MFNYCIDLDLSDAIQRSMYFGTMEPFETEWVRKWLHRGMVVVDAGANVGYYTLLSASCVGPAGRVLAFEPSPGACAHLRKTVDENGLSQVSIMQFALGSSQGRGDLHIPEESYHNHTPSLVWGSQNTVSVEIRTLDECLAEARVQVIDLLKIDVEGYEVRVLRGASDALRAGKVRAVLSETNDGLLKLAGTSLDELYSLLKGAGFKASGNGETRSGNRIFVRD